MVFWSHWRDWDPEGYLNLFCIQMWVSNDCQVQSTWSQNWFKIITDIYNLTWKELTTRQVLTINSGTTFKAFSNFQPLTGLSLILFLSFIALSVSITGRQHTGCALSQRLLINAQTITASAAVTRQTKKQRGSRGDTNWNHYSVLRNSGDGQTEEQEGQTDKDIRLERITDYLLI